MKKLYLVALIGLVSHLKAQVYNKSFIPETFPKAPEVSAIGKFVDKPISIGTGSVDYQIPLETLLIDANISIPINLRYNTDGVRVNEESTNIGLGWTLTTTSFITRNIKGEGIDNYNTDIRKKIKEVTDGLHSGEGTAKYHWLEQNVGYGLDTEPDEFVVNIFNTNFRFYYNYETKNFQSVPYNDYVIKADISNLGMLTSFELIDTSGNHYFFGTNSETRVFTSPATIYDSNGSSSNSIKAHISSWYLEKIVTKDNNIIEFKYSINPNENFYHTSQFTYVSSTDNFLYGVNSPYAIFTEDPVEGFKKIGSKYPISDELVNNHKVDLINNTYTEIRNDDLFISQIKINGKKRIEFIKSGNQRKDAFSYKLEKINVFDLQEKLIKSFSLNQSYFNEEYSMFRNDCSRDKVSKYFKKYFDKNQFRLRLDGININDQLNNKINDYKFYYYEGELPSRLSYSQDLYGYYNGKDNCSLIPYQHYEYFHKNIPALVSIGESDRSTDINYGKIGSLKKIIYPTKGSLELDYESNIVSVINDYNDQDLEPIYQKDYIRWGLRDQSLDDEGNLLPFPNTYTYEFELEKDLLGKIFTFIDTTHPDDPYTSYANMYTVVLEKLDGNLNVIERKYLTNGNSPLPIRLSAGKYRINAFRSKLIEGQEDYDPYLGFDGYFEYDKIVDVINPENKEIVAGGLRIKSMINKDHNGEILLHKSFKYVHEDGLSSGILYGYPIKRENDYFKEIHKINGNIVFPLQSSAGAKVVYARVIEESKDFKTNQNIKTDYYFKNEMGEVGDTNSKYRFSTLPFNWKLNQLIKENEFLEDSILKSSEKKRNMKNFKIIDNYGIRIKAKNSIMRPFGETMLTNYDFEYEYYPLEIAFPYIEKEIIVENLSEGVITTETNYNYDSANHIQLTKQSTQNSKGETIITEYQYSPDLVGQEDYMTELKQANRISEPVVVKQKVDGTYISEVHNQYAEFNGTIQKSVVHQKKGSGIDINKTDDRKVIYSSYDNRGNLTQYALQNGISVAIIWGYNGLYPIAKIEGAAYSEVSAYISDLETKSNDGSLTKESFNTLRRAFPHAMITTYVYQPLVGVTSITAPNGQTEYYKYDAANRLEEIRNDKKEVIKTFKYNYKQP